MSFISSFIRQTPLASDDFLSKTKDSQDKTTTAVWRKKIRLLLQKNERLYNRQAFFFFCILLSHQQIFKLHSLLPSVASNPMASITTCPLRCDNSRICCSAFYHWRRAAPPHGDRAALLSLRSCHVVSKRFIRGGPTSPPPPAIDPRRR